MNRSVESVALFLTCALLGGCADRTSAARFAVGTTSRSLSDPSRPTPQNGSEPSHPERQLPTDVWYPALEDGVDAPLAAFDSPRGLVLFVHGLSGDRQSYTGLTVELARAGFVVAASNFPLTAGSTPGGATDLHLDDQILDLSFVADALFADPQLGSAIAQGGYGVVGHSSGGTVALLTAYASDPHDSRVRAVVALAPCACFFGDAFFRERALPLLVVAGTDDLFVPAASNGVRAFNLALPPKQLLLLPGGNHLYFTDYPVPDYAVPQQPTTAEDNIAVTLARFGGGSACSPAPPPANDPELSFEEQHTRTLAEMIPFLDGALSR